MNFIVLDFETYYAKDYSLSQMTTQEYIRDPRFKAHGFSVKINGGKTVWVTAKNVPVVLNKLELHKHCLIGHHLNFDGGILNWHYGVKPKRYLDTLGMARATIGAHSARKSLDAVSKLLLKRSKLDGLVQTLGFRDLSPQQERMLIPYANEDVELTWDIFRRMVPHVPRDELRCLDWTVRAFVEPKVFMDTDMLEDYIAEVKQIKLDALHRAGLDNRDMLMSNPQFARALEMFGVNPPTKYNAKGKETFAFAKTDQGLKDLLEHDNPAVQALVAARLELKSTIEETRAIKYHASSLLGPWPVHLNYAGAETTQRFSGGKGAGGNCLHPDCEVLTPKGWVKFSQLSQGELVATWDSESGYSGWENADVVKLPFKGNLVSIRTATRTHHCVYTPDHRVPVVRYHTKGVSPVNAGDLASISTHFKIPNSSTFVGGNSCKTITSELARYLAALQADGEDQGTGARFDFHKQRKYDRLISIVESCGLKYRVQSANKGLPRLKVLHQDSRYSFAKRLGPWLLSMSPEALEAFVDETKYWDSYRRAESWQYFTTVKDNAEWLQTICHLTGRSAQIQLGPNGMANDGRQLQLYTVNIKPRNFVSIEQKRKPISLLPYEGDVYCLKTKRGGFLIRSNGAISCTYNCQNMKRGGTLRNAIYVREGYEMAVADLAQIELRITLELGRLMSKASGEFDALEIMRNGGDLYSWFGSRIYGYEISKATHPLERQTAKSAVLGLGFGMGAARFMDYCKEQGIEMSAEMAQNIVNLYRNTFTGVVQFWYHCNNMLKALANDYECNMPTDEHPIVSAGRDPLFNAPAIRLPNGMYIKYPELSCNEDKDWSYLAGNARTKLFGGKVTENIVQALAALLMRGQLVEISDELRSMAIQEEMNTAVETEADVVMSTHDELAAIYPIGWRDEVKELMTRVMTRPPEWMPDLPLGIDFHTGLRYGEAK